MILRSVTIFATLLITAGVSFADRKEDLVNPIPYVITKPKGYIDSPVDPETLYQSKRRGFVDAEVMTEITPHVLPQNQLPPPTVVPHGDYEPVERVVSSPKKIPPPKGEDKIFQQIARDQLEIECMLDDSLDKCEGIEIEIPEEKPRSRRVIDRQIQTSPGTN